MILKTKISLTWEIVLMTKLKRWLNRLGTGALIAGGIMILLGEGDVTQGLELAGSITGIVGSLVVIAKEILNK